MKKLASSLLILTLLVPSLACSVDTALSDIDLVLQTASAVCSTIGVVLPADAAACAVVAGVATAGVNLVKTDYDAWKASGSTTDLEKLQSAISVLKTNLPAELAAAHITDAAAVRTVTAWVGLVTSSLDAVLALLPKLAANIPPRPSARMNQIAMAMPTPATLKARWDSEVCQGDAVCAAKVKVHKVRVWGK
jgi:hypothetical protein